MTILRIIKLLDQKQTFIFLLFFLLSIISMLLETISIGLLIVYFDNNFRCESTRFLKLYNFLEFNKKSKEEILFSIAIIILIIQTLKVSSLHIILFRQKFLTTIRAEISNKLLRFI